jgi:site-specific recombinase XerD
MVEGGAQTKKVQGVLGHSNYSTTMDFYVHTSPEMLRDAVNIAFANPLP